MGIKNEQPALNGESPKRTSAHPRPERPHVSLQELGRLRVANVLAVLGISATTLYDGIKSGRYPPPDGYDGRMPYWLTTTIRKHIEDAGATVVRDALGL